MELPKDLTVVATICSLIGALGFCRAVYGMGMGAIFLDTVECLGNESSLLDCYAQPIEVHDCFHFEDAGVSCFQEGKTL